MLPRRGALSIDRRHIPHPGEQPTRAGESGQAIVSFLLIFACLIIGGLALAIDFANLWFHRQATQTAADAACQAGAMDMLATSGGLQLKSMGFTAGTAGSCIASPSATMCAYANFNGYNGAGPQPVSNTNSAWNTVSWTFPTSVPGTTPPPSSMTATPYMQVTVVESVKTFFVSIFTDTNYQQVSSTCTCGLAQMKEAAPMIVLNPTASGAFTESGGGNLLNIVGGPQRSVQVNSTSPTAVSCSGSPTINTSYGGPNQTGSDIGVVALETQSQNGCGSNGGYMGFYGGTTGVWRDGVLPVPDPYAGVGAPTSVKLMTPATYNSTTKNYYTWVAQNVDGCPESQNSGTSGQNCLEYGPGYYPSGINVPNSYLTVIFLPGVYYLNGPLTLSGSVTARVAMPCWASYSSGFSAGACSSVSSANHLVYTQGSGVMFYFLSGSFNVSGCSGCSNSNVVNLPSDALTCDGTAPNPSLGMPTSLTGNILWGQCTQNATYYDAGGDSLDSVGSPGSRGILFFQDHANTAQPTFSGSGSLSFGGSLYFHSNSYSDILNLSGGSVSGTFILGNIVTDQLNLSGRAQINLQLSPVPSTYMLKATTFQ
jgi:Putative Flp pilus-assembly TadE/G-like